MTKRVAHVFCDAEKRDHSWKMFGTGGGGGVSRQCGRRMLEHDVAFERARKIKVDAGSQSAEIIDPKDSAKAVKLKARGRIRTMVALSGKAKFAGDGGAGTKIGVDLLAVGFAVLVVV